MKTIYLFLIGMLMAALFISVSTAQAWNGEPTFGPESREEILRRARQMVEFSWSPKATFTNLTLVISPASCPFTKDKIYTGETYTQSNPQQAWEGTAEFYDTVSNNISGGNYYLGNDCAGFVSISWKLPTRYTTWNFENDAVAEGGNVTSLGAKGDGIHSIPGLLPGDALVWRSAANDNGHIILFKSYEGNTGINVLEQTPCKARPRYWTWSALASYRPIRRNKIDEGNYEFKTTWGKLGDLNVQFYYPEGIAVDSSGNVYVADTYNHRIQKFTSNGGFLAIWGSYGIDNGRFNYPHDIAVDFSGNLYVPDNSYRIQKLNSSGDFVTKATGYFLPVGVATSLAGYVYLANQGCLFQLSNQYFVYKFDSNLNFKTKWGPCGYGDGWFNSIGKIAVDLYENIYVADSTNDRIQKLNSNGGFLAKWGSYSFCTNCSGVYFNSPAAVAVDSSGNVYVADTDNHRIQKLNSNGGFLAKWGSYGTGNGRFQYPEGVAVDSSGNVYVADTYNHRIQKFAPVSKLPTGPSNLTAATASSTQINLSWRDNSNNETGFKISRKTGIHGPYSTIATVGANVTSYTDSGRIAGTYYYYAVWAYNAAGDSAYSNEAIYCMWCD